MTKKIIESTNRNNIEVEHFENKWQLKLNTNLIFEISDPNQFEKSKIGFGFSGIGKGHVYLYGIRIEDKN
jgi:hypothetical protein